MPEIDQLQLFQLWNRDLERLSLEIKINQLLSCSIVRNDPIGARIQHKIATSNAKRSFNHSISSIHEQHFTSIKKSKITRCYSHFSHRYGNTKRTRFSNFEFNTVQKPQTLIVDVNVLQFAIRARRQQVELVLVRVHINNLKIEPDIALIIQTRVEFEH